MRAGQLQLRGHLSANDVPPGTGIYCRFEHSFVLSELNGRRPKDLHTRDPEHDRGAHRGPEANDRAAKYHRDRPVEIEWNNPSGWIDTSDHQRASWLARSRRRRADPDESKNERDRSERDRSSRENFRSLGHLYRCAPQRQEFTERDASRRPTSRVQLDQRSNDVAIALRGGPPHRTTLRRGENYPGFAERDPRCSKPSGPPGTTRGFSDRRAEVLGGLVTILR